MRYLAAILLILSLPVPCAAWAADSAATVMDGAVDDVRGDDGPGSSSRGVADSKILETNVAYPVLPAELVVVQH